MGRLWRTSSSRLLRMSARSWQFLVQRGLLVAPGASCTCHGVQAEAFWLLHTQEGPSNAPRDSLELRLTRPHTLNVSNMSVNIIKVYKYL